MFNRYRVCVTKNNCLIYESAFSSINQAVKNCVGFEYHYDDLIVQIYDELTDDIYPTSLVHKFCKEFRND